MRGTEAGAGATGVTPALLGGLLAAAGPWLPLAAIGTGLAVPPLAGAARGVLEPLLVATVVATVLAFRPGEAPRGLAAPAAILATLLSAACAWGLALALGAGPALRASVALAAAAPVAVGALGYGASLRVGGTGTPFLATNLLAPVALPAIAWLTATGAGSGGVTAELVAGRLAVLALLPALVAWPLRGWLAPGPVARGRWATLAVVTIALQALARMDGALGLAVDDPTGLALAAGLAVAVPLLGVLAMASFAPGMPPGAMILCGGFRNASLVWALLAPALGPRESLFFALLAITMFAMPVVAAHAPLKGVPRQP